MKSSIVTDYDKALRDKNYNAQQDNPARLPHGFHNVATSAGNVVGFYCPHCKLHIIGAEKVQHCGKISSVPDGRLVRLLNSLKTYRYNTMTLHWEQK
jgi:hypothetical protein